MTTQLTKQQRIDRGAAWMTPAATRVAFLVLVLGCAPLHIQTPEDNAVPPARPSARIYTVEYLPKVQIKLDGVLDETQWALAAIESDFVFPWQERAAS